METNHFTNVTLGCTEVLGKVHTSSGEFEHKNNWNAISSNYHDPCTNLSSCVQPAWPSRMIPPQGALPPGSGRTPSGGTWTALTGNTARPDPELLWPAGRMWKSQSCSVLRCLRMKTFLRWRQETADQQLERQVLMVMMDSCTVTWTCRMTYYITKTSKCCDANISWLSSACSYFQWKKPVLSQHAFGRKWWNMLSYVTTIRWSGMIPFVL